MRWTSVLVSIAVGLGATFASAAEGTLVVLNKSDATAWLIDEATGERRAELPTGAGPHEVAVSPDGRLAVVADYGQQDSGSTLTVIDVAAAKVVNTIELELEGRRYLRPHGIQFLANGRGVVVTTEGNQSILVVDVESGEVAGAFPTAQGGSHMLVLSPTAPRAFVANMGPGTVSAIDLATGERLANVPAGAQTEAIDITPDGREVWAANRQDDTITIIDADSLEVLAELECGRFPIRLKITPDGAHALISNANSGDVAVFDVAERREVGRISMQMTASEEAGEDRLFAGQFGDSPVPIGIQIRPDGKRAWVANTQADMVTVLDLDEWEVEGRIETGRQPDGLGWSPVVISASEER